MVSDIRGILKTMKKLDAQISDFLDTTEYQLVDPLSEIQEHLQETMEVIRTEMKSLKLEFKDGDD